MLYVNSLIVSVFTPLSIIKVISWRVLPRGGGDLNHLAFVHSHNRYNPLRDEWVLVCSDRFKRPWLGQVEEHEEDQQPHLDPKNPLRPGVTRPNGQVNPVYDGTYVFTNDFPALKPDTPLPDESDSPLFRASGAHGTCKVMCFHPKSDMTLARMTSQEVKEVFDKLAELVQELGQKYVWIQIYENRGRIIGCSNLHPHCQLWASSYMPSKVMVEDRTQRDYYIKYKKPMLIDYIQQELQKKERVILENSDWVWLVPYWAVWPYETMLVPKRHVLRLQDLTDAERNSLAAITRSLLTKYDNLFEVPFPYTMGWFGAPMGHYVNEDCSHWQLHAVYYPPLLRSAAIKKFFAGYELLAQSQREFTPERAAENLIKLSETHYKDKH